MNIDINKLREDLKDYFGSAMFNVSPIAMINLEEVEKASDEELIEIAISYGFDLNKYKDSYNKRRIF